MQEGDDYGEKDGSGCETEAGEGLLKPLFTGEAFGCAAIMRAGLVWVVHCGRVLVEGGEERESGLDFRMEASGGDNREVFGEFLQSFHRHLWLIT